MIRNKMWITAGVLVYGLSVISCGALLVGGAVAGGAIWYKGELKETVNASVPRTRLAVVAAVESLDLEVEEDSGDQLTAEVDARMSDGTEVKISMESKTKTTTEVSIRVGIMGDESKSRRILEEIKERL